MPFISASAISPYNVNLNLVGEKAFTFGNALLTDGVNDYASRGGQIGNNSNKMTISCWIDSIGSRAFLGSRVSADNSWLMTTNDANSTMILVFRNTDSSLAFCNVPNFNEWNHYFVVYDGTLSEANRLKIWINGTLTALSITGTIPTSLASNVGNSFEIGGATSSPIYGASKYDEVAIWDGVAGTGTEAVAAYNSGNGQFANGIGLGTPTSYYRLNGSDGDLTAIDEGSAGEDLTLNNFTRPPEFWVAHLFPLTQALNFKVDNVDAYAEASAVGMGATKLTVFMWTNRRVNGNNTINCMDSTFRYGWNFSWKDNNFISVNIRNNNTAATNALDGTTSGMSLMMFTYDSSLAEANRVKIYINGVSQALTSTTAAVMPSLTTQKLVIGELLGFNVQNGVMAYSAIYEGTVATPAEALSLYNSGTPIDPTSILGTPTRAYAGTGDDSTTELIDTGADGENATLYNFTSPQFISI